MSKLSVAAIMAVILSCLLGVFAFQENASLNELTSWSIKSEPVKVRPGGCAAQINLGRKIARLHNANSSNIVAIVLIERDGTVILNPRKQIGVKNFNYGPIPKLDHISKKQLDTLWNTSSFNSRDNVVTYELCVGNQKKNAVDQKHGEKMKVFIDAIFFSNKLTKYRIRCQFDNFLDNSDWIKV